MQALNGIRLLDLTHMLSGPYCGMMLADLGAETIKVEPPGSGEGTRRLLAGDSRYHREGMNAYFLTLNRNKKSVTINLKTKAGLALFYELARTADVVLDNFSAGVTGRLGIDHARLSEVNPRIITCTITGFGESGPARDLPSFDMVAQAMGGGMTLTGKPGDPQRSGIPIGDLGGGLMGVVGIVSALVSRATTGRGQHVDVSMMDAQLSLQNYVATMYALSGVVPMADGNEHPVHVPYNTFPVRDGHIIIAIITDDFWKNLMTVVELPELDTEENQVAAGRRRNCALINAPGRGLPDRDKGALDRDASRGPHSLRAGQHRGRCRDTSADPRPLYDGQRAACGRGRDPDAGEPDQAVGVARWRVFASTRPGR